MQIQPKDVRDMNGTLVLLSIVLFMPYMFWMSRSMTTGQIHQIPKWIRLAALVTNWTAIFLVVGVVRARLTKKMYARRAAEADGAGNREG
jgi:hypothetical protein